MKSIRARFNKQDSNSGLGAYILLQRAIRGEMLKRRSIRDAFLSLVPKEDYDNNDINALIKHLEEVSNTPEDDHLETKNESETSLNTKDDTYMLFSNLRSHSPKSTLKI